MLVACFFYGVVFAAAATYAQEITPDAQASRTASNSLMTLIERPDETLLIFELKIGSILLGDALVTYEDVESGNYYVPLYDFLQILEMPITVDNQAGTAQGWSVNEGATFALSLPQGTVTLRGNEEPLNNGDAELHDDGIYVSLKALEGWLPITIDVNFSDLAIIVSSLQPLPVENRLERDKARDKVGYGQNSTLKKNHLERPEAPSFTLPFVDTSIQNSYTNSKTASKSLNLQYSATARSIIAGQDALYSINDQTADDNRPDVRLTLGRKAFEGEQLFAGLAEYAAGDVSTREMPLIAGSNAGRGLFFTNISPLTNSLGGSDTTTLRGNLPVGYQVDIKRNGELINFIEEPDENGEYVFEDLFVLPGLNVFELVFYGPQGQEIVEEKRIFVPQNPVEKGRFEYRVHAIQDNTNLFTNRDDSDEDTGELRVTAEASYGISELSSVRAGVASYSMEGDKKDYALLGFSTSWKGLRFNVDQAIDDIGNAASLRIESVFKGFRWQAQHQYFNKFLSEVNDSSSLSGDPEHETDIRISGMLPFLFLKNMPLTLQINREQNTAGDEQYEWSLRATKNIDRIRITTELEQTVPPVNDISTDLNFQVSSRFNDFTLRGTARYELEPDAALQSINLTSDVTIDERTKLRLGLSRSGAEDPLHSFTVGLNRDIGMAKIGLNTTYDDTGNLTALLGASFGLAYDAKRNAPYISSKPLSESSGLFAKVYRDLDADNIPDEDEPYLEDVGFMLTGNKRVFTTAQDGAVFIPELGSFERSTVEISSSTFPNPFMKSNPSKIDYLMRPSQIHTHEYPVVLTGEVDGNVSILKASGNAPASSIIFDILRPDGSVIVSGASEFDGFFLVPDVPIGNHIVAPNAQQLDKLGYCPIARQPVILSAEEPFYTVPGEVVLYPHPDLIDENRWLVLATGLPVPAAEALKAQDYDLGAGDVDVESDILGEGVDSADLDGESADAPQAVAVSAGLKTLLPRYLYRNVETLNLYSVLSGPYKDLSAIQTCANLNERGYVCEEIIQLGCDDFKRLRKTESFNAY